LKIDEVVDVPRNTVVALPDVPITFTPEMLNPMLFVPLYVPVPT